MKAIIDPETNAIRMLVGDDAISDPSVTRTIVYEAYPAEKPGHTIVQGSVTITDKEARYSWTHQPLPLRAITKLECRDRIGQANYDTLDAIASGDPEQGKRWALATELDPADPVTLGMAEQFIAAGLIPIPLWELFR